MKILFERRTRSLRTNKGNTRPSSSWDPTSRSSLTSFATTPKEPLWFRAKLKCSKNCEWLSLTSWMNPMNFIVNCWIFVRPQLKAVEKEAEVILKFPEVEAIAPPAIQLDEVTFSYSNSGRTILSRVNLSASSDSRICIVSFSIFPKQTFNHC